MRLRNIKGAAEFIASSPFVVHEPEQYKDRWDAFFENQNPLHVEIGMGKGQFIHTLAENNPDVNYIGIEMYSSVLYRALERRAETDIKNLFFLRFDAKYLDTIFGTGEVDKIYLNFSDPWPKDRHAKRRLTSPGFLNLYDAVLSGNGTIQFKTDNRPLFDYSVESVTQTGLFTINELSYDLHHSEFVKDNVMTEYENRFVSEGKPICRMVLKRQ